MDAFLLQCSYGDVCGRLKTDLATSAEPVERPGLGQLASCHNTPCSNPVNLLMDRPLFKIQEAMPDQYKIALDKLDS